LLNLWSCMLLSTAKAWSQTHHRLAAEVDVFDFTKPILSL
jgi:hypothetical protein